MRIKKTRQVVPGDFASTLRRMRETSDPRLSAVLRLAHHNGWTYRALGSALGMSFQAVHQRVENGSGNAAGVDIPLPPRTPTPPPKAPRPRLRLKPALVQELREMNAVAATVNGGTPADHPSRRVSEHLSAQLAAYVAQGVTVSYLARVLGVTDNAVSFRLARHGFRQAPPSVARTHGGVYKNRKTGDGPGREACKRGHRRTPENVLVMASGAKACRPCDRERHREHRLRKAMAAGGGVS